MTIEKSDKCECCEATTTAGYIFCHVLGYEVRLEECDEMFGRLVKLMNDL